MIRHSAEERSSGFGIENGWYNERIAAAGEVTCWSWVTSDPSHSLSKILWHAENPPVMRSSQQTTHYPFFFSTTDTKPVYSMTAN